jgi:phage terminase large subunit-like protein
MLLSPREAATILYHWLAWARPEQVAPEGDWTSWIYLGGRGTGKTRTGAEWIRDRVEHRISRRVALVASTAADARDVMVEGESGLLAVSPPWNKPHFEPSKRRLTWPNGAIATLYSAEEPDTLRGPQHDTAWADEVCKWSYPDETWDNLQFGLRLGQRPQQIITTTPRPIPLLKSILARTDTVRTFGTTYDNRINLAPVFFTEIIRRYEGTRLGRQELNAEILEDVEGALWTRAMLNQALLTPEQRSNIVQMQRVVVAVDPSGTKGGDNRDDVGIVVAGRGTDDKGYVIADYTCSLSPAGWGKRAADAAAFFNADRVVGEENFGGAMVEHVILTAGCTAPYRSVTASRGKVVRAEPIAALYEQGRVKHLQGFPELEDELCNFTVAGYVGDRSPNRADALVWALTELRLERTRSFS